jgi:hypothetical protein
LDVSVGQLPGREGIIDILTAERIDTEYAPVGDISTANEICWVGFPGLVRAEG